jgi:hypothetical protein
MNSDRKKQLTCAEDMLEKAAEVVTATTITFPRENQGDVQADLGPVFSHLEPITWKKKPPSAALIDGIGSLDKEQAYFLRTGQIGGKNEINGKFYEDRGHWQLLFFQETAAGGVWHCYSSPNKPNDTYFDVTCPDGSLTDIAIEKLTISNQRNWGDESGKFCIKLIAATPALVIETANYLLGFRNGGDDFLLQYTNEKFARMDAQTVPIEPAHYLQALHPTPKLIKMPTSMASPNLPEQRNPLPALPTTPPSISKTDAFKALEAQFNSQLDDLNKEALPLLKHKKSKKAAEAILKLINQLRQAGDPYFASAKTEALSKQFMEACMQHIIQAKPYFKEHPGVKKIIKNILAIVFTLGVALWADIAMHRGKVTLFQGKPIDVKTAPLEELLKNIQQASRKK